MWCFDKRVIGGVALGGLALLAVNPTWAGAALPFLILAICPLSMLLMIRHQPGGGTCQLPHHEAADTPPAEVAQLRDQVAQLRAEVARRNHEAATSER